MAATAMAWLPPLTAATPRARSCGVKVSSLAAAPRTLNEPTRCSSSGLAVTGTPSDWESPGLGTVGVRMTCPAMRSAAAVISATSIRLRSHQRTRRSGHHLAPESAVRPHDHSLRRSASRPSSRQRSRQDQHSGQPGSDDGYGPASETNCLSGGHSGRPTPHCPLTQPSPRGQGEFPMAWVPLACARSGEVPPAGWWSRHALLAAGAAGSGEDACGVRTGPREHAVVTPLTSWAAAADECGTQILLKCEHQQKTGSFKVRGALGQAAEPECLPA